jgi:signal transduction histidine kinase/ActR/RegA family two-component response regulator
MNPYSPATLGDLKPGDHVALIYKTEEEHRSVMEPFVREGLERGQKVIYIADTHSPGAIRDLFRKGAFDVEPFLDCGQLVITGPEETYLRDGVFDPHGVLSLWREEVERAVAQGYTGLRATGEMSWALREPPGCEQLIDYEARVCEFCEDSQCLALCQYNQRHFGSDLLMDVLQTHRTIILGTELCHNFYYFPLAALTGHSLPAARCDIWLMNLLRLNRFLESVSNDQAQLRESEEMEAIGKLAGGVAHDLNTLLMAVSGHAELMLSTAAPEDSRRSGLEGILEASREAATLVDQLLAFGRKQMLRPVALNLNAVVTKMQSRLSSVVDENVEVNIFLEPTLELVNGDSGQLEEVLMHLAVNASDSMPEGGQLTITTENVSISEKQSKTMPDTRPGRFVRLSMTDTGVGMNEETAMRAFEPFFTTKDGAKGLGLSAVYGVLKQHEGWVDVRSQSGQGSVFSLYLPTLSAECEVEISVVPLSEKLRGGGECILVVEDEDIARGWITHLLHGSGYETIEASSAEEALETFNSERNRISLVLTDVVLPDKDGAELVEELLSINPTLPVLLSSGYSNEGHRIQELLKDDVAFLQKPFTRAELLGKLSELLAPARGSEDET